MIVDCNAMKFRGIMNPYTGEEMEVKMLVRQDGAPMFFCPDTYSTSTRYPSAQAAIDAWDRQNGVGGLKKRDSLKCAYTGADLRIVEDCAGFYLDGGFDPHRMMTDDEFVYYANMRNGKSAMREPGTNSRVESVERIEKSEDKSDDSGPDSEMLKAAEQTVSQFKDSLGLKKTSMVNGAELKKGKRR